MKGVANIFMDNSILNEESINVNYQNILQGKLTNTLMMITSKSFRLDKFNNSAVAKINGFELNINDFKNYKFNSTMKRIFDIFIIKLTKSLPYKKNLADYTKYQKISVSLSEYMTLCELKNKTKSIEQLRNALNLIGHIQVQFTDTRFIRKNKIETEFYIFRLVQNIDRNRSEGYSIIFSLDFIKYLANYSYIMPFPMKLLQINLRNYPFAYGIGRRLALHHNMNIRKSNADIISVKSLLESLSLPTYEEVLNGSGNITRYIIEPFNKNMNHLLELNILDSWSYSDTYKNYNDWSKLYIKFSFSDYPVRETITKS